MKIEFFRIIAINRYKAQKVMIPILTKPTIFPRKPAKEEGKGDTIDVYI